MVNLRWTAGLVMVAVTGLDVCVLDQPAARAAANGRAGAPAAQPTAAAQLSRPEMEAFMLRAKIVQRRGISKGVTGTSRVTLSDGTTSHDVSVQAIDESRRAFQGAMGTELNFRDAWQFNVAAYELDKLLDIQMIPATVARRFNGRDASFTWWVDDVMMDEGERLKRGVRPPDQQAWNEQMWVVRVFDQLIYNTDRNLGNLLISKDWRIWMIDHTRAFRWHKTLKAVGNLTRCDRKLLAAMKRLDRPGLQKALGKYLGDPEISGLLARRDEIVRVFDERGEAVLYDRR